MANVTEDNGDDTEQWPAPSMRVGLTTRPAPARTPNGVRLSRRPAVGLASVVVLGLVAILIAGVSAEPLWLALGHGVRGTATVTACTGSGLDQQCRARFVVPGQPAAAPPVTLIGASAAQRRTGVRLPAEV